MMAGKWDDRSACGSVAACVVAIAAVFVSGFNLVDESLRMSVLWTWCAASVDVRVCMEAGKRVA